MFEIERKPMPENTCRQKYPWDKMSVGDSFLVPKNVAPTDHGMRSAARRASRQRGWQFSVRQCADGYRVYRTA